MNEENQQISVTSFQVMKQVHARYEADKYEWRVNEDYRKAVKKDLFYKVSELYYEENFANGGDKQYILDVIYEEWAGSHERPGIYCAPDRILIHCTGELMAYTKVKLGVVSTERKEYR